MTRRRERFAPVYLPPEAPLFFPNPRLEQGFDGLMAVGGDLSVERLLLAYHSGIFPWYSEGTEILWWSPNPRTLIELQSVHLSRSLRRRLLREEFTFSVDQDFEGVMVACGERAEGTWILPEMLSAYQALHACGHAHSFEVWQSGKLVGGLYGVAVGSAFAAESMFHRVTDASKAALIVAVRALHRLGFTLFDVQYLTDHLARMGATEVSRDTYLERLEGARRQTIDFSRVTLDWK